MFPPLNEQTCGNCRYHRRVRGEDVCCRYAPELGAAGMMPLCSAAGWCGEWVEQEAGE